MTTLTYIYYVFILITLSHCSRYQNHNVGKRGISLRKKPTKRTLDITIADINPQSSASVEQCIVVSVCKVLTGVCGGGRVDGERAHGLTGGGRALPLGQHTRLGAATGRDPPILWLVR